MSLKNPGRDLQLSYFHKIIDNAQHYIVKNHQNEILLLNYKIIRGDFLPAETIY